MRHILRNKLFMDFRVSVELEAQNVGGEGPRNRLHLGVNNLPFSKRYEGHVKFDKIVPPLSRSVCPFRPADTLSKFVPTIRLKN